MDSSELGTPLLMLLLSSLTLAGLVAVVINRHNGPVGGSSTIL